jgi:hypothetical protein
VTRQLFTFFDPDKYLDPDNESIAYKSIHEYRATYVTDRMIDDWWCVTFYG